LPKLYIFNNSLLVNIKKRKNGLSATKKTKKVLKIEVTASLIKIEN
jgi:hypothetical protein